jgi:hypothetical protein
MHSNTTRTKENTISHSQHINPTYTMKCRPTNKAPKSLDSSVFPLVRTAGLVYSTVSY